MPVKPVIVLVPIAMVKLPQYATVLLAQHTFENHIGRIRQHRPSSPSRATHPNQNTRPVIPTTEVD